MEQKIQFYHFSTVLGLLLFGLVLSLSIKNKKELSNDKFKQEKTKKKVKETFEKYNKKDTLIFLRNDGNKIYYNYYFKNKIKVKI